MSNILEKHVSIRNKGYLIGILQTNKLTMEDLGTEDLHQQDLPSGDRWLFAIPRLFRSVSRKAVTRSLGHMSGS